MANEPEQHNRKAAQHSSNRIIGSNDAAAAVDCLTSRIVNLGGCHATRFPRDNRIVCEALSQASSGSAP
jgi:hypothetical protein